MKINKVLAWTPKILSVLITILLFAFVFQFTPEGYELNNFFMALIPGLVAMLILMLGWFFPKVGGALYLLSAIGYTILALDKVALAMVITLAGLCVITGVLYVLQKKEVLEKPAEQKNKKEDLKKPKAKEEKSEVAESPMPAPQEQPVELPPLPPKVEKPEDAKDVKVDYKEPTFFGDTPAVVEKKEEEIESKILEPIPPEPEKSVVEDTKLAKEDHSIHEVINAAPITNEAKSPTLPSKVESDLKKALVVEEPLQKEESGEVPKDIPEVTAEEPKPVSELSALEYPTENETANSSPKIEEEKSQQSPDVVEVPASVEEEEREFQLPDVPEKKTVAPWKTTTENEEKDPASNLDESQNKGLELPEISLTNKGAAQSGDSYSAPKQPQEGNSDFMKWAQQ